MCKKSDQLGMNPSTASGRLVKDLLFNFIKKANITCYHCQGELTRDTYSIEHKEPWLDSSDPLGLFFDIKNISFSHLKCNVGAARRPVKYSSKEERKQAKNTQNKTSRSKVPKDIRKSRRRETYLRTGN